MKEITKDMFGTKYKGGQAEMCSQYLIPIVAGIVAGIVKVCTKAQGLMYMLLDAISFTGSCFAFLTLFLVFGNAHNGTRLWDQYDNDKSYGGLSPAYSTDYSGVVGGGGWVVSQYRPAGRPNFEGLVLGSIEANFCKYYLVNMRWNYLSVRKED